MPDEWNFLDDDGDDDNNSIESMNFDNFNSDFLDDDEDDNSNTHSIDDDLFGEEDTSLSSTNNTIGNAQTPQAQHVAQPDPVPVDPTPPDDGIAFGIVDPKDNTNVTRGQTDLEDGVTVDDDGMLDFSDSLVDDGSQSQSYGNQAYNDDSTTGQSSYDDTQFQSTYEDINTGQQTPSYNTTAYDGGASSNDTTLADQGYDQSQVAYDQPDSYGDQSHYDGSYNQSQYGVDVSSAVPTDQNGVPFNQDSYDQPVQSAVVDAQQSMTTNNMDGDEQMNPQPQGSTGYQSNWIQNNTGGNSYSSQSQQAYAGTTSTTANQLDLQTITKIIKIVDDYRELDQNQQGYVRGFLDVAHQMGKSSIEMDGTEASVIKSIIEIDPNLREGVIELDNTKKMDGSQRAFHLISLSANQLKNINTILRMMGVAQDDLRVTNDLVSIRDAAMQLDSVLNNSFGMEQQTAIAPVLQILQDVKKIMEG